MVPRLDLQEVLSGIQQRMQSRRRGAQLKGNRAPVATREQIKRNLPPQSYPPKGITLPFPARRRRRTSSWRC
ncbi:Hypothetical predicted protein [Podarcis lilfordi]|uniref:Uncharacterized protein n=1 Tax=Podarcis lilfordi TaxID=74358 RepID=A0AA35KQ36_9SAUR|nr:Hypothetical predicted protein [Podarcis lilfordi]